MNFTIPADKANHIVYGAAITAVVTLFTGLLIGLAVCAVWGLAKEYVYDAHHTDVHTVDWRDAAATLLGGCIVAASHMRLP